MSLSTTTTLGVTLNGNYVLTLVANDHNARIYFDKFNPSKPLGFDMGYLWEPINPEKIDHILRPNMNSEEFIALYLELSTLAVDALYEEGDDTEGAIASHNLRRDRDEILVA